MSESNYGWISSFLKSLPSRFRGIVHNFID